MSKTTYTLSDIMDDLLREYFVVNEGDTDALRKAIQRVCKKISVGGVDLWEKSTKYKDGAKKPYHEFDEYERDLILTSPKIHSYVYRHKSSKEQTEYDEAEKQAKMESEAEQQALESGEVIAGLKEMENGNPDPVYISDTELQNKKLMLMVEALYLRDFEPIDEEELLDDMRLAGMWQGDDVTPDCVLAKMRLKQGSKVVSRNGPVDKVPPKLQPYGIIEIRGGCKDDGTAKRSNEHVDTGHRGIDPRKSFAPANQSAGFI